MRRTALQTLLLMIFAAGCGEDPAGPIPAELAGRWEADPFCLPACWFRIRSVADTAVSLDLTDRASANLRLDIQRAGTFRFRLSASGIEAFDDTGTLTVRDGMLLLQTTGGVDTLDYSLAPGFMTVAFRERLAFDFDGDGTQEEASAAARLERVP